MLRLNLVKNVVFFNGIVFFIFGLAFDLGLAQTALSATFLLSVLWVVLSVRKGTVAKHLFFLFVALLPIINLSKGGFFFYNIISLILMIIVGVYIKEHGIKNFVGIIGGIYSNILFFSFLLYIFSVINMGRYDSNIKIFELVLTAILFARLIRDRNELLFLTRLLSLASVAIVLLMMLETRGSSNRLMVDTSEYLNNGIDIGGSNPINYGLPIVFCLLTHLLIGPFLFRKRLILRSAVPIFLIIPLLLTTSRGSLLVLMLSLVVYLFLSQRFQILMYSMVLCLVGYSIFYVLTEVHSEFAASYAFLVTRTQELNDINQISHGRLEQWIGMFDFTAANFSQMIFGFGPGNQNYAHSIISSVLSEDSASFVGREFAYHALILRLISEIGLLGLFIYVAVLFQIAKKVLMNVKYRREFHFATFFVGWFAIGLSVSSFDAFSGLFLGMSISSISIRTINSKITDGL